MSGWPAHWAWRVQPPCHSSSARCMPHRSSSSESSRPTTHPAAAWCSYTRSQPRRASPARAGACTCSRVASHLANHCTSTGGWRAMSFPRAHAWLYAAQQFACTHALLTPPAGAPRTRRQSSYLFGRERRVVDVPTDHPSCSKQHAVLQYRLTEKEGKDGMMKATVRCGWGRAVVQRTQGEEGAGGGACGALLLAKPAAGCSFAAAHAGTQMHACRLPVITSPLPLPPLPSPPAPPPPLPLHAGPT